MLLIADRMQDIQEPSSRVPCSIPPNLMDSEVPTFAPLTYVGVNEELEGIDADEKGVSVISTSLLGKLKNRARIRVMNIGMMHDDAKEEGECSHSPIVQGSTDGTHVNPSNNQALSDEVDTELRAKKRMSMEMQHIQNYRSSRDQFATPSSSVIYPQSQAPTLQQPLNAAEIARQCLINAQTTEVLVATPNDGGVPYVVKVGEFNSDSSVQYEFIATRDAIKRGLIQAPTFDPSTMAPSEYPPGSKKAGKRPMPTEDRLEEFADQLNLVRRKGSANRERREYELTAGMKPRYDDTDSEKRLKEFERRKMMYETDAYNDLTVGINTKDAAFKQDIIEHFTELYDRHRRDNGFKPPKDEVLYWLIYFPFLREHLASPPYSYEFADADMENVINWARRFQERNTDSTESEDSVKATLASAFINIDELQKKPILNPADEQMLELLQGIVSKFTKALQDLGSMMESSSGFYMRGFLRTNEAKRAKTGLSVQPQVMLMERLYETLRMGSAGTSQSTNKHIIEVEKRTFGPKNEYIERVNELCKRYNAQNITPSEQAQIETLYNEAFEQYEIRENDIRTAHRTYMETVADASNSTARIEKRITQLLYEKDQIEKQKASPSGEQSLFDLEVQLRSIDGQIAQSKFAQMNFNRVISVANHKMRYQRSARRVLDGHHKEMRQQSAESRRMKKEDLSREYAKDPVAEARKMAEEKVERIRTDFRRAQSLQSDLQDKKTKFEKEKEEKKAEKKHMDDNDKSEEIKLEEKIRQLKPEVEDAQKASLLVHLADTASKPSASETSNSTIDTIKSELLKLKSQFKNAVAKADSCAQELAEKTKVYGNANKLKEYVDEYNKLLSSTRGTPNEASKQFAKSLSETIEPNIFILKEGNPEQIKPEAITTILTIADELKIDLTNKENKCRERKAFAETKMKAIRSKEMQLNELVGGIIEDLFSEKTVKFMKDFESQSLNEKSTMLLDLMTRKTSLQSAMKSRKDNFQVDYGIPRSVFDLNKSSSMVAKEYADTYLELKNTMDRIDSSLMNLNDTRQLNDGEMKEFLDLFGEGTRRSRIATHLRGLSVAVEFADTTPLGRAMEENLANKLVQSNRTIPQARVEDRGDMEIEEVLNEAVTGSGFTDRLRKKMRIEEYRDAVNDIIRFANAGSGRALNFYQKICEYAVKLSSKMVEDIRDCSLPLSGEQNLTIHWENLESYTPLAGSVNHAKNLIYVVVQWTRLPMERRAGSMPSREQLERWIERGIISDGDDLSRPEIDPLTGELMVVTNQDSLYNQSRGIKYNKYAEAYDMPPIYGENRQSEPLGAIKRTPVSWVAINRGPFTDVHVPINDELSICRKRATIAGSARRKWALHLTKSEAVREFMGYDFGEETGKELRAYAEYEVAEKWELSEAYDGCYYGEFNPVDFSAAFWTAVETSRDNHVRMIDDYKTFTDQATQLKLKWQELRDIVDQEEVTKFSIETVASVAEEAGIAVPDAGADSTRLANLSTMKNEVSAILVVYRQLKSTELARDMLAYRLGADFGIPREETRYKRLDENQMQQFHTRLSKTETLMSSVEMSKVLDRGPDLIQLPTDKNGMNASATNRMWLDIPHLVNKAVQLFNQFLRVYYPWETPLEETDEGKIFEFLDWMRRLNSRNFTHIVLLMDGENSMQMWVKGVNGGRASQRASQRVLGPGFTSSQEGFTKDSEQNRKNQSRWYTYASSWEDNMASRVKGFETSFINPHFGEGGTYVRHKFEEATRAIVKQSTEKPLRNDLLRGTNANDTPAHGMSLAQQAERAYEKMQELAKRNAVAEAAHSQLDNTMDTPGTTLGSNPLITVNTEASDGDEKGPRELTVSLFDIKSEDMGFVIKALRRQFPGSYSTCMRTVLVNKNEEKVGTIIQNNLPPTYGIVADSIFQLEANSETIGTPGFVDWVRKEAERAKEHARLASMNAWLYTQADLAVKESRNRDAQGLDSDGKGVEVISDDGSDSDTDEDASVDVEVPDAESDDAVAEDVDEDVEMVSDDAVGDVEVRDADGVFANASDLDSDANFGGDSIGELEDEQNAIQDADFYISSLEDKHISEPNRDMLDSMLRVYDPGMLKDPVAACGRPIQPIALPDFEIETV